MISGTVTDNKAILKKLFIGAFIVKCLMEIMNSAASLIDTWFVGNYIGSAGVAATGYARPFFSFVDILCGPLGLGMQLTCSAQIGKGEIDRANKVFSGSLSIGIVLSVLLAVVGYANSTAVASLYGKASAEIVPLAGDYLKGLFLGAPAMIVHGILAPIVHLSDGKKKISLSIIMQFAADVVFDALSVFVFHGGMFGLGLATALSYYASLIPLVVYFIRDDAIFKPYPALLSASDLKTIYRSGRSMAIKRVCNTVKPMILNGLSLLLGAVLALSVYSVTNMVRDTLISFSAGTANAVILIGALLYGQRDRESLRALSRLAVKSIYYIAAVCALVIVCARPIATLFMQDSEEIISMTAMSIRCVGLMIPFSAMNGLIIAMMQITKRLRLVSILSYLNRLVLIVGTSVLLGVLFGPAGMWWALPVSEILTLLISLIILTKKCGRFPRSAFDLLALDDDFGYHPEDYIEISIRSAEDVATLQDGVKGFCEKHGIDKRRTFFTELALEELAMNVITHGFPKCKNKTPEIHVWIVYEDGNVKLRFQDNCPGFNVMKKCSELQNMSRENCVGLRLVCKISQSMNYTNTLNTNNLFITV